MTTEHAAMIAEFHLAQQRRLQRLHLHPSDPPQDPAHPEAVEVADRLKLVDMVAKAMAQLPYRS